MGVEPANVERVDLVRMPAFVVSITDTGSGDDAAWTPDGDLTIHVLWQQDEEDAAITAGDEFFPIAPGDTMTVPGGTPIRRTAGMLLAQIEATSRTLLGVIAPSHGEESYEGYNRRTDYETPEAFTLQRWKITQPLDIPATGTPFALIDLPAPLALVWSGGTDLIEPGECRVVEPQTGPLTLLSDGLGYALIVR